MTTADPAPPAAALPPLSFAVAGALPLPAGEPPVVEVYVADATQRNARPRKAAVVEGTAREVGR